MTGVVRMRFRTEDGVWAGEIDLAAWLQQAMPEEVRGLLGPEPGSGLIAEDIIRWYGDLGRYEIAKEALDHSIAGLGYPQEMRRMWIEATVDHEALGRWIEIHCPASDAGGR